MRDIVQDLETVMYPTGGLKNMDDVTISSLTVESPRVVREREEVESLLARLKEGKETVDAALGAVRLDDEE